MPKYRPGRRRGVRGGDTAQGASLGLGNCWEYRISRHFTLGESYCEDGSVQQDYQRTCQDSSSEPKNRSKMQISTAN
eukprot:3043306-Rhodomonas_salina.1